MAKSKSDIEAKIEVAREAVDKAAALLLEHAEGFVALAMVARAQDLQGPQTFTLEDAGGHMLIRNVAAERAYAQAVEAAAMFAGRFEAFVHARGMMHSVYAMTLRRAVEELVGPDGGMPPPISRMPANVGDTELGITPADVHAQAWRSHLAANADNPRDVLAGGAPRSYDPLLDGEIRPVIPGIPRYDPLDFISTRVENCEPATEETRCPCGLPYSECQDGPNATQDDCWVYGSEMGDAGEHPG